MTDQLYNPLEINLDAQLASLKDRLPAGSALLNDLQNAPSRAAFLSTLSQLALKPSLTEHVAATFRPLLLDLCARWLSNTELTLEKFEAFCLLISIHEELFPVLSSFIRAHLSPDGPLDFVIHSPSPETLDATLLHRVLLAYFRLLQANGELPGHLAWPLDPLSKLIWSRHSDLAVRLMAVWCYAFQSGMGEAERDKLLADVVGDISKVDCLLRVGEDEDGSAKFVDGWIIAALESSRLHRARNAIASDSWDFYGGRTHEPILQHELSPLVADVHGVLMLRESGTVPAHHSLVPTSTSICALRAIALRLSLRQPTLITSPPSSGKTLFLSYLAEILHPGVVNQVITISLADTSLDPRSLLGSYQSSPTKPGTFEWREGILVRAMRAGRWVVFKDIDRGSSEVLGTIKPLVESLGPTKWIGGRARILVPSRGEVIAEEGFAIFATRSLQPSPAGSFSKATFFGAHKFSEVAVGSPSTAELRTIVDLHFPRLAGAAANSIIRLWNEMKDLAITTPSRAIGLRELDKFCARINHILPTSFIPADVDPLSDPAPSLSAVFLNPSLREDVFCEARDVFFGAGALTSAAHALVQSMVALAAQHLGLSLEQRDWLLRGRSYDFKVETDGDGRNTAVCIGRTRLPALEAKLEITPPVMRPFAMHRPAVALMARIASALVLSEPILLTGETGTGKTSVVSHLAGLLRRPLVALNLSQQTESADLLGGFKPVDARVPGVELQGRFVELFRKTFSQKKNAQFEESAARAVREKKWKRAVGLWRESTKMARDRLESRLSETSGDQLDSQAPRKKRKTSDLTTSLQKWRDFDDAVSVFEVQHIQNRGKFAFSFVEGPLVKALRSGDWILLDEINLASPETLEAVSGLLHSPTSSITLTEKGSLELIPRHPDFRLFACMNPATDVGKKDLPPNIRSRFTEIDVPPPDSDRETLLSIVEQYIGFVAVGDRAAVMDVAEFYTAVKKLADSRQLSDSANHRPHFSMRTLARALLFAADITESLGLRRALWEGCLMAFTMVLDAASAEVVTALAERHILSGVRNIRSLLAREPAPPRDRLMEDFVKIGPFYLERGPCDLDAGEDYILTPSVEQKLIGLARIVATRRFPVLIEGPTSSGKTSSIEYLARRTGHRFVRINNHEHTDIQEYIGTYVSDPQTGKLVFKDGLLLQALRNGDWIVLDELNLAPTDVLEALNRLLDDNRELVIPETQEVVRPHSHFMLFATQNPSGLYAGRKVLSRAFRNRFLEVHFEDVPQAELETILHQRCRIAPSYAQRIVAVFRELQMRRQSSRVFESRHGFATLRDLFRWAGRQACGYQELAEDGYMLLAERARRDDDKLVVKEVIESVMKVRIDEHKLYDFEALMPTAAEYLGFEAPSGASPVWTRSMRRLVVLLGRALRFNEPVLLVGETGTGKTSVCQLYADAIHKRLHSVNCHQNTETADLIGGLRPVRNRAALEAEAIREASEVLALGNVIDVPKDLNTLAAALHRVSKTMPPLSIQAAEVRSKIQRLSSIFEWHDGPLVEAMRRGDILLLDEISLADDSVLERLNSVLEPSRTVVLAERGGGSTAGAAIVAAQGFQLVSTMNPGGDYGKKELSPALRNRFTEVWVPAIEDRADLEQIVSASWRHNPLKQLSRPLLDFCEWFSARVSDRTVLGLRDILAWVAFSNSIFDAQEPHKLSLHEILYHGARLVCLDGLGSLPVLASYSSAALVLLKNEALAKLSELAPAAGPAEESSLLIDEAETSIQLGLFTIPRGPHNSTMRGYNLGAPTTWTNAMRVARACQLSKPILLEGSPGVGKTSLVVALAKLCGYHLCRINLSDQSDLSDLFGTDLPVEGGQAGEFAWRDAEFLTAMQEGSWVLLDEMNLAPQSVLEGLNAVLDHRGTVFIPELGRSFTKHPAFRVFAAQNPIQQGGGRKGLPKSFVNRFTKVYIEPLTPQDLRIISHHLFPKYPEDWLFRMIDYNSLLEQEIVVQKLFGRAGSPWEFNLRDLARWGTVLCAGNQDLHPVEHLRSIYLSRFRTEEDRIAASALFISIFGSDNVLHRSLHYSITPSVVQIGHFVQERANFSSLMPPPSLLQSHLPWVEAMGVALQQQWLVIVTGARGSGKTNFVRLVARLAGSALQEVSINNATDATDLLGSFEQVDRQSRYIDFLRRTNDIIGKYLRTGPGSQLLSSEARQLRLWANGTVVLESSAIRLAITALDKLDNGDETLEYDKRELHRTLSSEIAMPAAEGRFEWVDGPLVRALKQGHWLLLDNANLCNPSVLDRLNALCEPSGVLTLNEQGVVGGRVPVIRPHPHFRLIMCVDPQYGELSRAMRNRGIEVVLPAARLEEDSARMHSCMRIPCLFSQDTSAFEILRRGLAPASTQEDASLWSSALIPGDSASSSSKNLALVLSSPSPPPPHLDSLLFASRSIVPALFANTCRVVGAGESDIQISSLSALFVHEFWNRLEVARAGFGRIWPVYFNLLPHEPVDFFAKITTYSPALYSQRVHNSILCALEAFVRYCEQEHRNRRVILPATTKHNSSEDPLSEEVLRQVARIASATQDVSAALLMSMPADPMAILVAGFEALIGTQKIVSFLDDLVRDDVNISAVRAITKWLAALLESAPHTFIPIRDSVQVLDQLVTPASGLGLSEIWTAMRSPTVSLQKILATQEREARSVDYTAAKTYEPSLRQELLNLIAILSISADEATRSASEHALREMLERFPISLFEGSSSDTEILELQAILAKELDVVSNLRPGRSQSNLLAIDSVISLACACPVLNTARLVPYKLITWKLREDQLSTADVISVHRSWHQALWDADGTSGPSAFLFPVQLTGVTRICDWSDVSTASLNEYERNLGRWRDILLSGDGEASRPKQIRELLRIAVELAESCFPRHRRESDEPLSSAEGLHPSLQQILAQAHALSEDSTDFRCDIAHLGQKFIDYFFAFVELYVPDTPLDPAAIQRCENEFWTSEESSLQTQQELHRTLEHLTTGSKTNGVLSWLEEQAVFASEHVRRPPSAVQCAPRTMSRLRDYWAEVVQFLSQVVSREKLHRLTALLEHDAESATMRENVVQESIRGFTQRMVTAYGDFDDINGPLHFALLQLRFGLRLSVQGHRTRKQMIVASTPSTLTLFPTIHASRALLTYSVSETPALGLRPFDHVGLSLACVTIEVDAGVRLIPRISRLESVFEQALRLWSIDQARQREEEAAGQSLYRSKRIDGQAVNDSEVEAEEFFALFPNYENALGDENAVSGNIPPLTMQAKHPDVQFIYDVYLHLFSPSVPGRRIDLLQQFLILRCTNVQKYLSEQQADLPATLDEQSFNFMLSMLHQRFHSFQNRVQSDSRPYDFYLHSNVPEIRQAMVIVTAMARRLQVIIREWPEQMVLQHLSARCDQVLRLSIHSPVARVLAAVEQLLLQSEDWEMYSNKENSLKEHRQALTGLIVQWRKLELASWQDLLETQAAVFESALSEWWFRMYNACIRALFDVVSAMSSLDSFFDELVPLVDDFVSSSPLGQLLSRVRLLDSFASWVKLLVPTKSSVEAAALSRLLSILVSTVAHYKQFTAQVTASLASQRESLEKDIRDFIKLASWRDINVQALKASAKKTHVQLYKSIRKFREILRQPASLLLRIEHATSSSISSGFIVSLPPITTPSVPLSLLSTDDRRPVHLRDLSRTYERFDMLIRSRVDVYTAEHLQAPLYDFATEILVTADELARTPLPTNGPAERRVKLGKALLVRKRKAWSDLLKELKRIGLAFNVQPGIAARQSSVRWIREQPKPLSLDGLIPEVETLERYFFKFMGLMPQLRASLNHHHDDLATRELQRGVTLLESGLTFALTLRTHLAQGVEDFARLRRLNQRLEDFGRSNRILAFGSSATNSILDVQDCMSCMVHALEETADHAHMLGDLSSPPSNEFFTELSELIGETRRLRDELKATTDRVQASRNPIWLDDEYAFAMQAARHLEAVPNHLAAWSARESPLRPVLDPVQKWAQTLPVTLPPPPQIEHATQNVDHLIDALLVVVQSLISAIPETSSDKLDDGDDGYVKSTAALLGQITDHLHLSEVIGKIDAVFDQLTLCPQNELQQTGARVLPFLQRYEQVVHRHLSTLVNWTGSLFRLEYVVCSVMLTVATKGFCKPPEGDDEGDGGETGEATGGVGLGEGTGAQDVSKEIEDESQVEGLQGEQDSAQEQREKGENEKEDAIEMGQDFEGEMEDIPEDGEEESGEDGEDDGEEGPEDQVGDVDPLDPSAVDEKLWGDEKGPEGKDDEGKTQDDRSKETGAESEVVAKEKEGSKKEKEEERDGREKSSAPEADADESMQEDGGDDGAAEDEPAGEGAPMDDFVQDANTLDLPDDLDLGEEEKREIGSDDGMDMDDGMSEDLDQPEPDTGGEEFRPDEPDAMDEGGDGNQPNAVADDQSPEPEHENDPDEGKDAGATAEPDIQAGEQGASDAANADSLNTEARESAPQNQSTSTRGGGAQSLGQGADAHDDDGIMQDAEQAATQKQLSTAQAEAAGIGAADTGTQQGSATSQDNRPSDLQNNPLRSLGDALREIRQRFDDILERAGAEDRPVPQPADAAEASQLEYLQPDDEDQNMQALGPAGGEEAARLQDLKLVDDETEDPPEDGTAPMNVDDPPPPPTGPPPQTSSLPAQPTAEALQPGIEDALTQHQIRSQGSANTDDVAMEDGPVKRESDLEEHLPEDVVESELRRWQADGHQPEGVEHLWRLYESLTHDLSYSLCEQLRLILEPTQATRLKGDYRTGKRLNMKKVIPYIASEYTKDKIWLRRTRPSQREYQVLIALDDSRSMSESHSVHLAYQTLALVAKALTRLEVGELGVAKFGEAVEVLHGFDGGPFSDATGAKVMGSFGFDQRATDVRAMVETSLRILEEARERRATASSTAAELWQLEIIISDGICQDHGKLQTLLRKAEEQRVMVVFIVIDSLHSSVDAASSGGARGTAENSILSMKQVAYKNVDGRMELQMQRYLDSFPFEYYVVLRNVEALPEVLAGTLKQFFERISDA